jgi:hypothetical protein
VIPDYENNETVVLNEDVELNLLELNLNGNPGENI